MKYTIRGKDMPVVDVELKKGEALYTESGGMAWKSPNVSMTSSMKGGVSGAVGRMFSGESLFLVTYECTEGMGTISFCSEMPGNILDLDISTDNPIICQRDAFMAAEPSVELKVEFTKRLGAGFFGGEGFILQKLTGNGKVFLEFSGELTEYTLKKDQTLQIDPGYIGAFEHTVQYDLQRVEGIKNMLFSGEGLFLATLSGPGKVWLQSMPLQNLAAKLHRYMPRK